MCLKEHIRTCHQQEYSFDDVATHYFELPDNIQLSQIMNECKIARNYHHRILAVNSLIACDQCDALDLSEIKKAKYNFHQIAKRIYMKYVGDKEGDLCVNISYLDREKLEKMDFGKLDLWQLYHVFDDVYYAMLRLLREPYRRFTKTGTFHRWKQQAVYGSLYYEMRKTKDQRLHMMLFQIALCFEHRCCCFSKCGDRS